MTIRLYLNSGGALAASYNCRIPQRQSVNSICELAVGATATAENSCSAYYLIVADYAMATACAMHSDHSSLSGKRCTH
jgi:hypothetical protein